MRGFNANTQNRSCVCVVCVCGPYRQHKAERIDRPRSNPAFILLPQVKGKFRLGHQAKNSANTKVGSKHRDVEYIAIPHCHEQQVNAELGDVHVGVLRHVKLCLGVGVETHCSVNVVSVECVACERVDKVMLYVCVVCVVCERVCVSVCVFVCLLRACLKPLVYRVPSVR